MILYNCADCKYYLNSFENCQGQDKICHEFCLNTI